MSSTTISEDPNPEVQVIEGPCSLCEGPLVAGVCPAYHWHDKIHLKNRALIEQGREPNPPALIESVMKARGPITNLKNNSAGLCWVCGAPLDAEGVNCTAVNAPFHTENVPGMEGFFDDKPLFHTQAEAVNAPPVTFLVDQFLQREGVTAIAAPVRERKSLIALNVVHALLTGQPLFDHFEVTKRPLRVIYLCPEVSLGPFMDRVKKIGLINYVGGKFLCRTLSADGSLELDDPELRKVLPYSVVILDTAIRFLEGDENSSQDVRAFADSLFALLKHGAEAVLMLHHSPKDSGDFMSLENAMRGSGDLGALLCCCWGTKLQDPADPYKSASFMSNLKQRDFESQDFELSCTPDCRMHFVDKGLAVSLAPRKGFKANKDGQDDNAVAFLRANATLSLREAVLGLKGLGIQRSKSWVSNKRYEIMQQSAELSDTGS